MRGTPVALTVLTMARSIAFAAALLSMLSVSAIGCATEAGDDEAEASSSALGFAQAPNILFPGDPACNGGGCEAALASSNLFIPDRSGQPWGDTYAMGVAEAQSVGGFSSGRIALLRRLMYQPNGQKWAVMLDPSYEDGARDFARDGKYVSTTGAAIVTAWLRGDPSRQFMILFNPALEGEDSYVALQGVADIGARVKVCTAQVGHLQFPVAVGAEAITSPATWDNGTCTVGGPGSGSGPKDGSGSGGGSKSDDCYSGSLKRMVSHGTCVMLKGQLYVCDRAQPTVWPEAGAPGSPACVTCPQYAGGLCPAH